MAGSRSGNRATHRVLRLSRRGGQSPSGVQVPSRAVQVDVDDPRLTHLCAHALDIAHEHARSWTGAELACRVRKPFCMKAVGQRRGSRERLTSAFRNSTSALAKRVRVWRSGQSGSGVGVCREGLLGTEGPCAYSTGCGQGSASAVRRPVLICAWWQALGVQAATCTVHRQAPRLLRSGGMSSGSSACIRMVPGGRRGIRTS